MEQTDDLLVATSEKNSGKEAGQAFNALHVLGQWGNS
jgi:hypothetical protein